MNYYFVNIILILSGSKHREVEKVLSLENAQTDLDRENSFLQI